jgi:hypothetical protein
LRTAPFFVSFAFLVPVLLNQSLAATGPFRIAKDFPHSFQYHSGERFFSMGDTAYFPIGQPTNVVQSRLPLTNSLTTISFPP